jgi:SAM-dependent methyltransferase
MERILDLGSGEHGGTWVATRSQTILLDVQSRHRPDVVGDAQALPFRDGSFDGVVAISILEHVPHPWSSVLEIHRVLRQGGLVIGYVPYMFPYHADATFHDYFRFSDEALRSLFDRFTAIELLPSGGYARTVLRFLAGFTAFERHLRKAESATALFLEGVVRASGIADSIGIRGLRRSPTGYNFLAEK